jgi:hypothetical protein
MCFGVYICIFTLCFMFIAANIVGCRLRHQDARCTHSLLSQYCKASHFVVVVVIFMYWEGGGGAPNVRFAPVVPWAKTGPGYTVRIANLLKAYGKWKFAANRATWWERARDKERRRWILHCVHLRWVHTCNVTAYRNAVRLQVTDTKRSYIWTSSRASWRNSILRVSK